jgi:tetratricopeptide (TPR) repeat protein
MPPNYWQQIVDERIQASTAALERGNHQAALHLWKETSNDYPDLVMKSRAALLVLVGLNRFDEADALMQEGQIRYRRNPFFLEGSALVAWRRGDFEEAARRYALLRRKFPRLRSGYSVAPLIRLGRLDEADDILGRAYDDKNLDSGVEYARLAMMRKDWSAALQRWQNISNLRPENETVMVSIAQCYRELGRFKEAQQVAVGALERPRLNALAFWVELARIAEAREDWPEATRLWHDVRLRSPSMTEAYCHTALALSNCGQDAKAEAILHEATQRFASEPRPWIEYARIAERRGSIEEAKARWEWLRARFPEYKEST